MFAWKKKLYVNAWRRDITIYFKHIYVRMAHARIIGLIPVTGSTRVCVQNSEQLYYILCRGVRPTTVLSDCIHVFSLWYLIMFSISIIYRRSVNRKRND